MILALVSSVFFQEPLSCMQGFLNKSVIDQLVDGNCVNHPKNPSMVIVPSLELSG